MSDTKVQVLDRAFDIIELLAIEPDGLGVSELARKLSLNKSTVHRIVNSIAERGYLEKDADGVYRIGMQFIELTSRKLSHIELATEARPFLQELTDRLGQPSHLAIRDGSDAVYIDKVEVTKNLRLYSQIGKRIPIYCSGLGKSLILDLDDRAVEALLANCRMEAFTSHTLRSVDDLLEELRECRKKGWTSDDEEHDEGIRCIAAPIYDYRRKVIAAVSLAGSISFFTKDRDDELGPLVFEIAQKISGRMGYFDY